MAIGEPMLDEFSTAVMTIVHVSKCYYHLSCQGSTVFINLLTLCPRPGHLSFRSRLGPGIAKYSFSPLDLHPVVFDNVLDL